MTTYNVAKTTLGPASVPSGSVIQSQIIISNTSPAFDSDYSYQIGMGDWTQRVPSVIAGQNTLGEVGIRFLNGGAVAGLTGTLDEQGSALRISNFVGGLIDGTPSPISFVCRVYAGINNFAPLIATFPGTDLQGGGVLVPPFAGTQFYVEIEALNSNVIMHRINVGEATSDVLQSVSDPVPVAPSGISRSWTATHSLDNSLLPATSGVGAINWGAVILPAGESITINVLDTVPDDGDYENSVTISGIVGEDDGVWLATGTEVTVLPPPPDLADCGGASDIQARQAWVSGSLKGVNAPAYAQFVVYHAATNNIVWRSEPIPGNGQNPQAIEVAVPFGASVLLPNTTYNYVIEVYDETGQYLTQSPRCESFTTQAQYSYLSCGAVPADDLVRHAVRVENPRPALIDDSGQNRYGPEGWFNGQTSFNVTYEYWDGTDWRIATTRETANSYGLPAAIANPALVTGSGLPQNIVFTNLPGDGQAYPIRKTLRNGANQIVEQLECAQHRTARVPPLQCPDNVAMLNNSGVLTFGPVDRVQYDFAERDEVVVQVRRTGTSEPFAAVGSVILPNGEGSAGLTDTVNIAIAGLIPGTTYDTRVVYISDPGFPPRGYNGAVCQSAITTLGTAPITPTATCGSATSITLSTATISGTASGDPGTSAHLEWSTSQNGPWTSAPPVALGALNVALTANLAGLAPADTIFFRTIVTANATNAVLAGSGLCSFMTRAPNAFITPTATADCPPSTNTVEEGEPPMDVTVDFTLTHFNGADPITGHLMIDLTSMPSGATIVEWTATTTGTVTGSALSGVTDPDETITLTPGSSIAYEVTYHVPGPLGGDLTSTMTFDGPGADQVWQASSTCHIAEKRLDCDPAFAQVGNIPKDRPLRQVTYDGTSYNVQLEPGWTMDELVSALNAQGGQFATDGENIFTTPESRWAHGSLEFTYLDNPQVIDFGTGGQNGARFESAGADADYMFTPSGQIIENENQGAYAVTSFQDVGLVGFNNADGLLTADALGDPNGNALIVNASFQPGEFNRQVISTVPGVTYATSFWIANTNSASGQIRPNVSIDFADENDVVFATFSTGPIMNRGVWNQFFADIVAPGSQVTFIMRNNGPGGNGNDLAIDQIEAGAVVTETVMFEPGECPDTGDFTYNPNGALTCETGCSPSPAEAWPYIIPPYFEPPAE